MNDNVSTNKEQSGFEKFIKKVEVAGNKLPHPFTIFCILTVLTLLLSFVLAKTGTSVTYIAASRNAGEAPVETTVAVKNLLSKEGLRPFLTSFVKTYSGFAPLGVILTMMLGIGLVEQTGLISALMRKTLLGAPSYMVTAVLALVAVNGNIASDAGTIFSAAIGGAIFKALGRNPKIGIITGFCAASGGFTANFFIAGTDVLLSGVTESAAKGMGIEAPTHPLINWFFMIAATFVVTFVVTIITEKFTTKILGDEENTLDRSQLEAQALTRDEIRGLKVAGLTALAFIAIVLMLTIPQGSLFRNEAGKILPKSTLTKSIVPLLFFFFSSIGLVYGIVTKQIKSDKDMAKLMSNGLKGSLSFLVIAMPAAMFIYLFKQSNLTTILAVNGSELIKSLNLGAIPLILMFILLSTFLNLFLTSGSSKWLILAPIFVPMFSMLGLSPALTQLAYRIGDSSTNIVSPVSVYIPAVIGFMEQYKKDENEKIGIGTVMSLTLPYSIGLLVSLGILISVWYLLGLPLGPGTGVTM